MRKRYLAAAAAATFSFTALSQAPAFAADAPAGTLLHQVITNEQAGWAEPGGSTGITQGSITALPDGSSEIVVASSNEPPAMGIRYSTGSWDTNWTQLYESPAYVSASGASIAGMPNGDTQVIEVAQSAS